MALRRLSRWTNNLAWSVWSIHKKNRIRNAAGSGTLNPTADSTLITSDSIEYTADSF